VFLAACVCSEHFQLFEKKREFVGFHLDATIVNLVGAWIREAKSRGEFVFPVHEMFFQPRHGTVILFRSGWLQHCTMSVRDRRWELGCFNPYLNPSHIPLLCWITILYPHMIGGLPLTNHSNNPISFIFW